MSRFSMWLEWPAGVIRVGVVFLVCSATIAVVAAYATVLPEVGREATANSSLSFSDREIAGGNGIVADQLAVYAARALIPENESYHVAVSSEYEGGDELTLGHVAGYYRYFLMPRRPVEGGARWIVCYACDLAEYGGAADVVWAREDISIVRVGS